MDVSFGTIWEAVARDQPDARVVLLPRLPRTPTGKLEVSQVRRLARQDG